MILSWLLASAGLLPSTLGRAETSACGTTLVEPSLESRVVGGHLASVEAWPWMAYIEMPGSISSCSATIVSRRHVLTTVHCFVKELSAPLPLEVYTYARVKVGTAEPLNYTFEPIYSERSAKIIIPEDRSYLREKEFSGDIAIIELSVPLNFSSSIRPICLLGEFRERAGEFGFVAGFGDYDVVDESTGEVTEEGDGRLRENIVIFLAIQHCKRVVDKDNAWSRKYHNGEGTYAINHVEGLLCAGGIKRNIASGDSGGPLMVNKKGVWFHVGMPVWVTTTTDETAHVRRDSSVFIRIAPHCEWIKEATGGEVECVLADD